jgi:hypothetical protein
MKHLVNPFLLCLSVIALLPAACKKDHDSKPISEARIKTMAYDNIVITYFYDEKGRVKRAAANPGGYMQYVYTDTTVTIENYYPAGTLLEKEVYKLGANGLATGKTKNSIEYEFSYNSDGQLTLAKMYNMSSSARWEVHYSFTNGNRDSITDILSGLAPQTHTYFDEYDAGKLNSLSNENFGMAYLGADSKYLLKKFRYKNVSGIIPSTYTYEFDAHNRVIKKTHTTGNGGLTEPQVSYTWY